MAKIRVEYMVKIVQYIDWPDTEMGDFNHENLECNLEPERADTMDPYDITGVQVNGEPHEF